LTEYDVDWHLGPFDHDRACHIGDISWDVRAGIAMPEAEDDKPRVILETRDQMVGYLREYVGNHPRMTKSDILDALVTATKLSKDKWRGVWAEAQERGWITSVRKQRPEGKDQKLVTREVWLPGQGAVTLQEDKSTWAEQRCAANSFGPVFAGQARQVPDRLGGEQA
jgi:hypothetical protein